MAENPKAAAALDRYWQSDSRARAGYTEAMRGIAVGLFTAGYEAGVRDSTPAEPTASDAPADAASG